MRSTLESSNTHWCYYLKQQVAEDLRAYDAIVLAEKDHSSLVSDPQKTTDVVYRLFSDNVVEDLFSKRCKPKDAQVRRFLEYYYAMKQMKNEAVSEFSHTFVNTQHQIDRLIPGIHRTPSGKETELLYAYTIKLEPEIQKELVSRDFGKFKKKTKSVD